MRMWSLIVLTALATTAYAADAKPAKSSKPSNKKAAKVPLHEHPTLLKMLRENNRLRASVGLPPQQMSPELTKAAQDHAWYMARTGNFSHFSNGGPDGRAARHGFAGLVAENIAMGQVSVRSAFQSWRASSGHWANITSHNRLAGFGYGISPNGQKYWVAMYGN